MDNLFGREPVMVLAFLRALVVLGLAFGLTLNPEQIAAIFAAHGLTPPTRKDTTA